MSDNAQSHIGTATAIDHRGAFAPYTLATDLVRLRQLYADFFSRLTTADWQRRTERRKHGWTLREVVAHLDAIAQAYQHVIAAALTTQPIRLPGLTRRTDLRAWNRREIDSRMQLPIDTVCSSLLATLHEAARCAASLTPAELSARIVTPIYHGAMTVAELFGGQLAHAGLVHAAQVANGARVAPLWIHYTPGLMQRQITRFIHIMGYAYWPERGGALQTAINFVVAGPGGGRWHVALAPDGGRGGEGIAERATLALWFRTADIACRAFTFQLDPLGALLGRHVRVRGDLRLGLQFPRLFMPT
jgi:Mycothiol maleylpyruvate isomerase N-terminal domain